MRVRVCGGLLEVVVRLATGWTWVQGKPAAWHLAARRRRRTRLAPAVLWVRHAITSSIAKRVQWAVSAPRMVDAEGLSAEGCSSTEAALVSRGSEEAGDSHSANERR